MASALSSVASRGLFYGSCALLVSALILGGSGAAAPLHNLIIELLALILLIVIFAERALFPLHRSELPAVTLTLMLVLTPLLQLVPLPFSIWSELPARDLAAGIDDALALRKSRPISVDPEATALAAAYILVPAALFLSGLRLGQDQRRWLVRIIGAGAATSLVLGVLQLATAGTSFHLYTNNHNGLATGFFANRNHQADFMLTGMLFVAALVSQLRTATSAIRLTLLLSAIVAFSAGVVATNSRTGFILLPIAVLGSLSFSYRGRGLPRPMSMMLVAAPILIIIVWFASSTATQTVIRRFGNFSDPRFEFWSDAVYGAKLYFPWGSGLGTFDPVFRTIENLDRVKPQYLNHAHNDYIQIIIETGAWGLALAILFIVLVGWLALRPQPNEEARVFARAAALSILILLLHSIVDYPLRIISILSLFGLSVALLHPPNTTGLRPSRRAKAFESA